MNGSENKLQEVYKVFLNDTAKVPEVRHMLDIKFDAVFELDRRAQEFIRRKRFSLTTFQKLVDYCINKYTRDWAFDTSISAEMVNQFQEVHMRNEVDWFADVTEEIEKNSLTVERWSELLATLMTKSLVDAFAVYFPITLNNILLRVKELEQWTS